MTAVRIGVSVLVCAALFAQQAAGPPAFEVASIKPSQDPPGSIVGIFESKGRISAKNVTLKRCVRGAYDLPEPQIIGGPKWADEDRYSIEAKAAVPAGDHELMRMLQTLLADRFKLVLHRERRTVPGYRLVLGKGGLKAQSSPPDRGSVGRSSRGRVEAESCTISRSSGRRMRCRPGLRPGRRAADAPEPGTGPSIFAALQEQVGLKLEAGKVSAEVLVLDSARKPTEN
jgi:hypothetical protein